MINSRISSRILFIIVCIGVSVVPFTGIQAAVCEAPDNGTGTVDLPANCPYTSIQPMMIIDGLPPGTTIELYPTYHNFSCVPGITACSLPLPPVLCEAPGGSLGGNFQCFEGNLELDVVGTGLLTGFVRTLYVPLSTEIHTGPRNPGDAVQNFPADMYRMFGEIFGDPDFCTFRITAGTDYGLPGPGQTILTELPSGDFNVDSFFDVTYQIEFEGCPGSVLDGFMGTTTAMDPWQQGEAAAFTPTPTATPLPGQCIAPDNGTGTVDLPADCPYTSEDLMMIIDGLAPGTTIEMDPTYHTFFCNSPMSCSTGMSPGVCEMIGGTLGGHLQCFEGTLDLVLSGTGSLAGFNRFLSVPLFTETHSAWRTPGNPIQNFSTDMFRLEGEIFGDPDFCTFRITAGTDYGLPGPGQTILSELPDGRFDVDSFFDITYQIQFEGCPGSILDGYQGTTTATVRWQQGIPGLPTPTPTETPTFTSPPVPTNTPGPTTIPTTSAWSFILLLLIFSGLLLIRFR